MGESNKKNDPIEDLIREEGLLTTSAGFTNRVMLLVEQKHLNAVPDYKPLISNSIWIMIAVVSFIMLSISLLPVTSMGSEQQELLNRFKSVTDYLSQIHFSLQINSGMLLLTTVIIASIGLLLFLDLLLTNRFRKII